jgi:hypothetical protein
VKLLKLVTGQSATFYLSGGVHGIVGKPRAGKSMAMVISLINELVNGSRTVVTNLPLRLPELSAYIQKQFPWADVDLHTRLRIITKEQCFEFWRFRGPLLDDGRFQKWVDLGPSDKDTGECDLTPIIPGVDPLTLEISIEEARAKAVHRCAYYIDEIHAFFNAREWMKRGKSAVWYVSQHGKLGDACILATHMVGDIDKQMRGRFQDWTYLRNLGKEKLGAIFSRGSMMVWHQYQEPKVQGTTLSDKGEFPLDVVGIGSCYSTDGGVGIACGAGGDKGERVKGLPIWVAALGLVVSLPLVYFGINFLSGQGHRGLTTFFGADKPTPGLSQRTKGSAGLSAPPAPVKPVLAPVPFQSTPNPVASPLTPLPPVLRVNGVLKIGQLSRVYFDDGSSEEFPASQVLKTSSGVVVLSSSVPVLFRWSLVKTLPPVPASPVPSTVVVAGLPSGLPE